MAVINFRAPALPLQPKEYDSSQMDQFQSALRLYFRLIDNTFSTLYDVPSYINFSAQSTAPPYLEGRVWYDDAQKSLAFYNDSPLSPVYIGENIVLKVYNNTGSTIAKGAAVYIVSGGPYTYPNVALAKADSLSTAAVIGLMNANTPTGTIGYVTSAGVITGVSTGAISEGTVLYLSPYSAGQLMGTVPPTGYVIQVGVVAHQNSPNGTIYTKQTTPLAISAATITGAVAVANGGTGMAAGYTVATLPAAGTKGRRSWVNDALSPTFGTAPTGGGTVVIPVFDNGTAWIVG